MRHLVDNCKFFQSATVDVLRDLFGIATTVQESVEEIASVHTEKTFIVSIYYTGTVYGEYILAMNEDTAAKILAIDEAEIHSNRLSVRDQVCDAFREALNMIVGKCLVRLQETYAKLTLTPPRVCFGSIRYPNFRTGKSVIQTAFGDIECHFCLDLMRLDLATSYQEALSSLLDVNDKLKQANQQLAQQQAQLVHSEKMASVGMLASGVAHEINNPLFFVDANLNTLGQYINVLDSVVGLYEKLCTRVHTADEELQAIISEVNSVRAAEDLDFVLEDTVHLLEESRQGLTRIKSIVKGLKEFSQVDIIGTTESDLNLIVHNAVTLLTHEFGGNRRIIIECQEIPNVLCNAAEIGQVILNLLLNASQAIDEIGYIRIRTYAKESDVFLEIQDDGCGISPENIRRIFEPFFTTKPVGKGTGLGLTIAYGIIQKHNGNIAIESEPGSGTLVRVRLPFHPSESLIAQPAICVG